MHAPSSIPLFPEGEPGARYDWALYRYTCFCAGTVLFLICLGGLVTSNEAGMSVPDWPNSYGYNMFLFPWQKWVGGIFFEHSHRLVGSALGVLILGLTIWLCFQPRVWLRWLGVAALIIVSIQGVLGGLRVIEKNAAIGIFHACLAQAFFVLVALMALFVSRWWIQSPTGTTPRHWRAWVLAITGLIFVQLAIGATMRHEHAGLSITDFPTAYGQLWPRTDPASVADYNLERLHHNLYATNALYINMQMAHRVGAVLITVGILGVAVAIWREPRSAPVLRAWSAAWVGLVLVQFALGAFTIWTNKAADVATTHVAVGALTLVTGALLSAMSWRLHSRAELATRERP
jgi:cytochrome c oxidase assembly protein subunit 15